MKSAVNKAVFILKGKNERKGSVDGMCVSSFSIFFITKIQ